VRHAVPSRQAEPRTGRPGRAAPIEPDTLTGSASPAAMLDDFERELDDGEGRSGMRIGIAFVIAAALLVVAYFVFARGGG
jgi:hypothetical protein